MNDRNVAIKWKADIYPNSAPLPVKKSDRRKRKLLTMGGKKMKIKRRRIIGTYRLLYSDR